MNNDLGFYWDRSFLADNAQSDFAFFKLLR